MNTLTTKARTDKCYHSICEAEGMSSVCSDNYTYGNPADTERTYRYCTYKDGAYQCTTGCEDNSHCDTGYYCKNKACIPNETSCSQLSDCANNNDGLIYCKLTTGTCTTTKCTTSTATSYCGDKIYCNTDNGGCYPLNDIITNCNSAKSMSNVYCRTGWLNSINNSCTNIGSKYGKTDGIYEITKSGTTGSTTSTCCATLSGTYQDLKGKTVYNIQYETNRFTNWSTSGTCRNFTAPVANIGTYTTKCSGKYQLNIQGGVKDTASFADCTNSKGGILIATKNYTANYVLGIKAIAGGCNSDGCGGVGMALVDGAYTLVAGGGGGNRGGGGKQGGGTMWTCNAGGYGLDGSKGTYGTFSSATSNNAQGGGLYAFGNNYGYGGSGSDLTDCATAGFTCTSIIAGGNAVGWGMSYTSAGNCEPGSVSIVYCGATAASACP